MELKVLLQIDDQIQFRRVQIIEEDDTVYRVVSNGLNVPYVRKSNLYQKVFGQVFGFDKEKMIEVWNESIQRDTETKTLELIRLSKSILPLNFDGDVYKIEGYRRGY